MHDALLGTTQRDRITGFQGVVTGYVYYISGCNQAVLAPPLDKDGKACDAQWFDVQRLEAVPATKVVLDNGKTPGCDVAPPTR